MSDSLYSNASSADATAGLPANNEKVNERTGLRLADGRVTLQTEDDTSFDANVEPVVLQLNRRQRRSLLRQLRREYRQNTRRWRRMWRGVYVQSEIAHVVKGMRR